MSKDEKFCALCRSHYGDLGPCDEGKPVNSPHLRAICGIPVFGRPHICVMPKGHGDYWHGMPVTTRSDPNSNAVS